MTDHEAKKDDVQLTLDLLQGHAQEIALDAARTPEVDCTRLPRGGVATVWKTTAVGVSEAVYPKSWFPQ